MIQEVVNANEDSEKDSSSKHKDNGVKYSLLKGKRVRGWFPRKCAVEILSDDNYDDDRKSTNNKQQRTKNGSEVKSKSRTYGEGKKRQ